MTQLISVILYLWSLESLGPLRRSSSPWFKTILTLVFFQADSQHL